MLQMLTLYSFNNWLTRKKMKKDTVSALILYSWSYSTSFIFSFQLFDI